MLVVVLVRRRLAMLRLRDNHIAGGAPVGRNSRDARAKLRADAVKA